MGEGVELRQDHHNKGLAVPVSQLFTLRREDIC